jgi:hypothetical protein
VSETRRDEQKLWLILFQIKGVRSRLNSIALQRWLFAGLAILIGGAGLTFLAAARFGPLTFLAVAIFLLMAAIVAIVHETMLVRAMRTSPAQAAAIADARSQMKGRLTTVLSLAATPKRSPLWAYLVEDTYGRREEFEPARIAPRWLSRALYPLLAAILSAALVLPAARLSRAPQRSPARPDAGEPDEITADISNLEIRPADPALQPNAEIYADPETLRKLADKLAAAQDTERKRRGLSKLIDKARGFADAFQNKLNGLDRAHSKPTRMHLTDRNPGSSNKHEGDDRNAGIGGNAHGGSDLASNSQHGAAAMSLPGEEENSPPPPLTSQPPQPADELAAKNPTTQMPPGSAPAPGANESPGNAGDANMGGGSGHGSGSDPGGLYGPASAQPLGSDSFKIAIEAEPSDESTSPGSPAYVPPKVHMPLNSNQYPDQPLARTAVPAADQSTVKRVFER